MRDKIYEDYLDDVAQDDLTLQDEQPTQEVEPTWMIKVNMRNMSTLRKEPFVRTLDFCMRYARECQFMDYSHVAVYKMEDYGIYKDRRKYQRYNICDKRRRDELIDLFEQWVGNSDYPICIRIEFTPAKVSMKVFVRWLRILGTFMRKNSSSSTSDAVYIEGFDDDVAYKWHIGVQSFFETR